MDWLLQPLIQATLGPVLSFLLTVVVFPLAVGLFYLFYRFTCGKPEDRSFTKLDAPQKMKWVMTQPSILSELFFVLVLAAVVGLWCYAQYTLYQQLLLQEEIAYEEAKITNTDCNTVERQRGRVTRYQRTGCDNAKDDLLTVVPSDVAYRRWFELMFSLWPWSDDGVAVAVPFGVGRLFMAVLVILVARERFAPTLTSLRGLGNRLFRTAAAA